MKKIFQIHILIFFWVTTLLTNSCKKEGPAGPVGPAGEVNISSYTFTASSWSSTSSYWYYNFTVPALTSSNIDSAAVQVYASTGGNWIALPYTEVASTNYFMGFNTGINNVQVTWIYNGLGLGSSPNSFYTATLRIKVVVIPPSVRKANPDIDYNNYNEVSTTFNLKEY